MIGAGNSPMSQFSAGPSMYEIGYNGGPGGAIANAMRQTIAKYQANLGAQQEQQNKMDLIKYTDQTESPWKYGTDGNVRPEIANPIAQGAGSSSEPDLRYVTGPDGTDFSYTREFDYKTGGYKNSQPTIVTKPLSYVKQLEEDRAKERLDRKRAVKVTIPEVNPFQVGLENGSVSQNPIQQGANGSVVDSVGSQSPDIVTQYMAMYPNKSREEIIAAMKQKGM